MIRRGKDVWLAEDLRSDRSWVMPWTSTELSEIDAALHAVKDKRLDWELIQAELFPLNAVAEKLALVANYLEYQRGLVKLTGLPVDKYSIEELQIIWMGLGVHLGSPRYQDYQGQLMRKICDEGGDPANKHEHIDSADSKFLSSKARTYSNGVLRFHTDRIDVVGLLTVSQALHGGGSKIVSIQAVHNEILQRRPDLLKVLYQPLYRSRLGEEHDGTNRVYDLPVFAICDGKFTSHYSRTYVEAAQLLHDTPRLRDEQWEALDLLAEVCEELCFTMTLERGDIQFLNNHVVYHARNAFEDGHDQEHKRLLLRLWLSMANSRKLPDDHNVLWGSTGAGELRGGIGQQVL